MGVPDNHLDHLERQRVELESNILQLQKSLYYWRTWEAEYDGLKEDIRALDDDATTSDFLRTGREFGGTLVNEDEVRVIIGEKQGLKRTRQQVVDLISRRIDYVKENVTSMEKRLRAAEDRLGALNAVEQPPGEAAGDFPMKEIIEELDEHGQIISSTTTNPGDQASDILDILKKAGVENIPDVPKLEGSTGTGPSLRKPSPDDIPTTNGAKQHKQEDSSAAAVKPNSPESTEGATALGDGHDKVSLESGAAKEVPIADVDESAEDAKLRREMLRYGLDEVGAVVAELELDEDGSEISMDDGYDSHAYDEEEEEEEDQFGRNTRSVLDEDYHQQMRELEARLNARGMWNVGKNTGSLPKNVKEDIEHAHKVKIDRAPDTESEPKPKAKKVAFANDLDIAPTPKSPAPETRKVVARATDIPVLSDSIVERTELVEETRPTSDAPKKVSRFRSARSTAGSNFDENPTTSCSNSSQPAKSPYSRKTTLPSPTSSLPLFPATRSEPKPFSQPISNITEKSPRVSKFERKILADTLVERDISEGTAKAPEPDELDEELHRKEIATEFYRMRNKMAKQNNSSQEEEQEVIPVETEEPPRRISKFRAARMV
ncbi:prefoldin-like protein [Aspergillus lucknowensis]|uniref:Prefoldin subunit-domain-containing protein n=1 Tax=Aspergillus lucknowensis TaxID=176173 RepID=A0ABR4M085_9EURO